jgi:plastocyanin
MSQRSQLSTERSYGDWLFKARGPHLFSPLPQALVVSTLFRAGFLTSHCTFNPFAHRSNTRVFDFFLHSKKKMKFTSAVAFFAAAAFPSVFADNFTVLVGQGGANYSPSTVTAKLGDFVLFKFVGGNHSVTQAPFAQPCTQAWLDDEKVAGADTGFLPPKGNDTPIVELHINDTKPMWLFCQQAKHCNNGMVMVINPPADGSKTLEQFKNNAASAPIPGYGHFANFSASAAASNSTTNSPNKPGSAHSAKVLSSGLAAAALLVSGLML